MKGLNVKKLAAIGAGAALMGMALAPMAAALTKEEILKGDGTPFDVVVGENAARTDYLWGGNIAAKLAQLATEDTDVSCNVLGWAEGTAPEGGDTSEECEGLNVGLTVGGKITFGSDSKVYESTNLNSLISANPEFNEEVTQSQLGGLYKNTVNWRFAAQNYTQTITEYIGFEADARMDYTHRDIDDLILRVKNPGDFNYRVHYSKGLPLDEAVSGSITDFQEGAGDNVKAVLFGKEYKLYDVDTVRSGGNISSTTLIKLVEATGEKTYDVGEEITGLMGDGEYEGQEMTVRVDNVWSTNEATFTLLDAEGNEVDEFAASAEGVYLEQNLEDSEGEYALDTSLFLKTINFNAATGEGKVVIAKGSDLLTIKNGAQYPYSQTDTTTTDDDWTAEFITGTSTSPDVNVITDVIIKNNVKLWKATGGFNPIYSGSTWGLTDGGTNEAIFLEGESEDVPGYGYAKIVFSGWKGDEDRTEIKIGDGKYLEYLDSGDSPHKIPFYLELPNNATQGTFTIDHQTFYYRTSETAVRFLIDATTDIINGTTPMSVADGNLVTDQGLWTPIATAESQTVDINGMTFSCTTYGAGPAFDFNCLADGNFQIATEEVSGLDNSSTSWIGSNTDSKTWYYDDQNTDLTASGRGIIPLTGSGTEDKIFNYAFLANETYGNIWLLLEASTDFDMQYSKDVRLYGTDTGEDGVVDATYYLPDLVDLGGASGDNDYYLAKFGFKDNTGWDTSVYIQTDSDEIWTKNNNISWYAGAVDYVNGSQDWNLRVDEPDSYTAAAYTDYGTEIRVTEGYFYASAPRNQEKLSVAIVGSDSTETVSGGTSFCGEEDCDYEALVLNEEQNINGTTYTVTGIECETCECSGVVGDLENIEVEPNVSTVKKLNKIGSQIVYTDDMAPNTGIVAVGGQFVNAKSAGAAFEGELTLDDLLTAASDTVVDKTVDGDWVVAGFTAADTATAAQEFIEMLDAVFE